MHAEADQQGLVQGMITGMRGLCNGLGPAMFGLIFSLFNVDLMEQTDDVAGVTTTPRPPPPPMAANVSDGGSSIFVFSDEDANMVTQVIPGPPFVFGALLVILALMVSAFIPESFQVEIFIITNTAFCAQTVLKSVTDILFYCCTVTILTRLLKVLESSFCNA